MKNPIRLKNYKIIFAAILIGVTAFSVFKYLEFTKEKYVLLENLNQLKGEVLTLEQAIGKEQELRNTLAQENSALKDTLQVNADKLTQLDTDLQNYQKTIEQLTSQIALAKTENIALREEQDRLLFDLDRVSQERDTLKVRLSSIPELKKTIREVSLQTRRAKSMMREITEQRRVIIGNRGYLIKDGKSTFPGTKIKIEVMPAP
jgi:TolA-binding protein